MTYTKAIQSGTLFEIWEYERAPNPDRLIRRKPRIRRVFRRERRADSILKCKASFVRLVRANLGQERPPALMTMTMHGIEDVDVSYRAYTLFGKRLRTMFGSHLSWLAVPEFQKRGAVHFHVLIWGLPPELPCLYSESFYTDKVGKRHRKHVCPKTRKCERNTRSLVPIWGHGFLDIVETDDNPRLSSYLGKYMSKAMHDKRLLGKRAYSASRNVLRPVSLNTSVSISIAKDVLEVPVDNPPLQEREYDTMYLGRCVYKSYSLEL